MASVFQKENTPEQSVLDIVRDSLSVDSNGNVSFRSRVGRGSGKAVQIPGSQFDEFVTLLVQTQKVREVLAEQQQQTEASSESTSSSESSSSSEE